MKTPNAAAATVQTTCQILLRRKEHFTGGSTSHVARVDMAKSIQNSSCRRPSSYENRPEDAVTTKAKVEQRLQCAELSTFRYHQGQARLFVVSAWRAAIAYAGVLGGLASEILINRSSNVEQFYLESSSRARPTRGLATSVYCQ